MDGVSEVLEAGDESLSMSGFERHFVSMNLGEGRGFRDISGCSGADSITDGRAAIFADLDDDGDLDIFSTSWTQGGGSEDLGRPGHLVYRNNVGQDASWVRVALEGRESGRDAWGAQVRMETAAGVHTKVKMAGSGFVSQFDPRLLFGLGAATEATSVEVRWPSGQVQTLPSVLAGSSIRIVEGVAEPIAVTERPARLLGPEDRPVLKVPGIVPRVGDPVPPLRTVSPEGVPVPLETGPMLLNFWATWCVTCDEEMRDLQGLVDELGLRVVGVSLDAEAGREARIARWRAEHGIRYPLVGLDGGDVEKVFRKGLIQLPLTLTVDRRGRVVSIHQGWSRTVENDVRRWWAAQVE